MLNGLEYVQHTCHPEVRWTCRSSLPASLSQALRTPLPLSPWPATNDPVSALATFCYICWLAGKEEETVGGGWVEYKEVSPSRQPQSKLNQCGAR